MSLLDQVHGLEAELAAERDCSTRARLAAVLGRCVNRAAAHMSVRHVVAELLAHAVGLAAHIGIAREHLIEVVDAAYQEVA